MFAVMHIQYRAILTGFREDVQEFNNTTVEPLDKGPYKGQSLATKGSILNTSSIRVAGPKVSFIQNG